MRNFIAAVTIAMGIFGRLFGSEELGPPTLETPGAQFAFVLLKEPSLPSEEELIASYEKFSGGGKGMSISESEEGDERKAEVLSVDVPNIGHAILALVPVPIPNGEAEANCQFSVSSFSESKELKEHSAHLMVSVITTDEGASPLGTMMAMTSLLAAAVDSTPSIGVYWGNAGATHPRDFFLSVAAEQEINPRILLWNGVSRAPEKGGKMSFLSRGMNQLALPDLYLICDQENASTSFGTFFDLLSYIAGRGEPIGAGETVGSTPDQRIPVEYVKSPADKEQTVWKVEY